MGDVGHEGDDGREEEEAEGESHSDTATRCHGGKPQE